MICDFGKALHNSIRGQFPNSVLNGRLFYWKQVIRRKIIEFKIEKEQIKLAMTERVFDILTVIPRDQILTKGIDYVREIIDAVCKTKHDTRKWDICLEKYFKNYWCSSDDFIKTWYICNKDEKYKSLQNRTNHALERYHRTTNEKNPTPHPSLKVFVTSLEKESRNQNYGEVVPPKYK